MANNIHRGSTLDSFLKEESVLAKGRATREAFSASQLPEDVARTVEAADYGHIDPELDKLTE